MHDEALEARKCVGHAGVDGRDGRNRPAADLRADPPPVPVKVPARVRRVVKRHARSLRAKRNARTRVAHARRALDVLVCMVVSAATAWRVRMRGRACGCWREGRGKVQACALPLLRMKGGARADFFARRRLTTLLKKESGSTRGTRRRMRCVLRRRSGAHPQARRTPRLASPRRPRKSPRIGPAGRGGGGRHRVLRDRGRGRAAGVGGVCRLARSPRHRCVCITSHPHLFGWSVGQAFGG